MNLLENALKFSPPESLVSLRVDLDAERRRDQSRRPRARGAGGGVRARVRAVPPRRRLRRARRRSRPRDRPRFRRGERRPCLGRVGRRVRARRSRSRCPWRLRRRILRHERSPSAGCSSWTTSRRSCARSRRPYGEPATTSSAAATAEEALTAAALRPPEAVILDLVLPDRSGVEVCRELRTWTSDPDPDPLGRRRGAREGGGARCGRRRLRHQAVRRRRAPRAPPSRDATRRALRGAGDPDRRARRRSREARRHDGRPAGAADAARVLDVAVAAPRTRASCSPIRRSSARCGALPTRSSRTISMSTFPSCAARSSRSRPGRGTC